VKNRFLKPLLSNSVLFVPLHRVFSEVQQRGGYGTVTAGKRWKEVCRALGHDLSGQTSVGLCKLNPVDP
jgi:hypothetical protein